MLSWTKLLRDSFSLASFRRRVLDTTMCMGGRGAVSEAGGVRQIAIALDDMQDIM